VGTFAPLTPSLGLNGLGRPVAALLVEVRGLSKPVRLEPHYFGGLLK
jgi:hypothetical protein